MREVASEEVAAYRDTVLRLARRYVGWSGAELDDLEQEGLIDVWRALANGVTPSRLIIERRMLDHVRFLRRFRRYEIPVDYLSLVDLDPRTFSAPEWAEHG